jgi:rare lipoprotein A
MLGGWLRAAAAIAACAMLTACASRPDPAPTNIGRVGKPYVVNGRTYTPAYDPKYDRTGEASWYGPQHHGRKTASGEVFDQNRLSAAHTTLPLPSLVEVTDLATGRKLKVRVNDRGPFVPGRIIDLSKAAAEQLGIRTRGVAKVRVRYLGPA